MSLQSAALLSRWWVVALLSWLPLSISADPATAPSNTWVTGGAVNAAVRIGHHLFVGGNFGGVYPADRHVGPFAAVSTTTGTNSPLPVLGGYVRRVIGDGTGGWLMGGYISGPGITGRRGVVHFRADGTINTSLPLIDGLVTALAVSGSTVFVGGGLFLEGTQHSLIAVDLNTGAVLPWDPAPDGQVSALAVADGVLFVTGRFTQIAGVARGRAAAFALPTLGIDAWNPVIGRPGESSADDMEVVGGTVYLAGSFSQVGGVDRYGLAAVDTGTGALLPWAPDANCNIYGIETASDRIYLGGCFTAVNGLPRNRLAAVDPVSGATLDWSASVDGEVRDLALDGSRLFLGGAFQQVLGEARGYLAAIDVAPASAVLAEWNPAPSGIVGGLALHGDMLAFGGGFAGLSALPRPGGLAEFDLRTAAPTNWTQSAWTEGGVNALATDGTRLFVGGNLASADAANRLRFLLALDAGTGQSVPGWEAPSTGTIRDLVLLGDRLYWMGFGSLGAVDLLSGATVDWNPDLSGGGVSDIDATADRVLIAGSFTAANGQPRNGVAALDPITGAPFPWVVTLPPFGSVSRLAILGQFALIGGRIGSGGSETVAAADLLSGALLPWDPGLSGNNARITALGASRSQVVVGGTFSSAMSTPRLRVASFGTTSGALASWDPAPNGLVSLAFADDAVTVIGGEFLDIAGVRRPGLAIFPEASGLPGPPEGLAATVDGTSVGLQWSPPWFGGAPSNYLIDVGTGPGLTDLLTVPTGSANTAFNASGVAPGRYYVRVRASNSSGSSTPSEEVSLIVVCEAPPPRPTAPSISVNNSDVSITWSPSPGATSYLLDAGTSFGAFNIGAFPVTGTSFTGAPPPGNYYIAVRAVNACGASQRSPEAVATVGGVTAPPPAPANLHAQVSNGSITLTWTSSGPLATSHVVDAGSAPGQSNLAAGIDVGLVTERTFTGVPSGSYYIRVRAIGMAGSSVPSAEVQVVVP